MLSPIFSPKLPSRQMMPSRPKLLFRRAKLFVDYTALAVLCDDAARGLLVGVRVEESVRKAEYVRGEAVAADVRRLPDRVARKPAQSVVDGEAELRATLVAPAVRADEVERVTRDDAAPKVFAVGD